MRVEKYKDVEILIDNNKYFIVSHWQNEVYQGKQHNVPCFEKSITEEEYKQISIRYQREKKLTRIIGDDINFIIQILSYKNTKR